MNGLKIRSCLCSSSRTCLVFLVFLGVCGTTVCAQGKLDLLPDVNQSVSAMSLGAGSVASLDTYLSPSEYTGVYIAGDYDRATLKSTDVFFPYRHLFIHFGAGLMKNHAGSMSADNVMIHGYGSWSHKIVTNGIWESLLGVSALGDLGGVLNSANTNNPFNAKFQLSAGAIFDNILHFRLKNRPMALKGTLHLPLLGVGFAPDNGEFYFDMASRGNLSGDFHVVTPFTVQTLSTRFALDVPICSQVVQVGYSLYLMRGKLGGNFSGLVHSYATVGLVHRFEHLKWK